VPKNDIAGGDFFQTRAHFRETIFFAVFNFSPEFTAFEKFYDENNTLRVCPKFIASAEIKVSRPEAPADQKKGPRVGRLLGDKK